MKSLWRQYGSAFLALLLSALMLVTGTAVAVESSAMATDGAPTSAMEHCHHHTPTLADMASDHAQAKPCPEGEACQCISLCQVSAMTVIRFTPASDRPAQDYLPGTVIDLSPGIHQLPLRPPSLTV